MWERRRDNNAGYLADALGAGVRLWPAEVALRVEEPFLTAATAPGFWSIMRRRATRSTSSASFAIPRASGPGKPSRSRPGRRSWSAACSAGSAPMVSGAFAPLTARYRGRTARARFRPGSRLYLLVADGEQGAEIYSAATTRDQARIVFDEAKRMVGSSPALKRRVGILINNLHVAATASRFMPLSSDASSMDGLNVHGAIIDELHAHKTRHVVDVLETATGARRQPLLFEITTAGYDRHSICFEHHDYSIKVLEGIRARRQLVRLHRGRRRERRLD